MKVIFSFFLFAVMIGSLSAQKIDNVKINVAKEEITVNNTVIKSGTSIQDVIKALGEPERIVKFAGKDRYYIYDSQGVAFSIIANSDKIETITITYTYDEDEKVAKEKFKGTLMVDAHTVTEKTTIKELNDKTAYDGIQCFGKLCASDPKKKGVIVMIGLTEKQEILQIVFGLKK